MLKKLYFVFLLLFILKANIFSYGKVNLKESIFTPTAYTPFQSNNKKNEKHLRIGLYGAGLYLPREEVDNLTGQSLSVLNFNIKWKILEDDGIVALSTGFNGFYPMGFVPDYLENEIFGSMYLCIGKAYKKFNFNTSIMYGTLFDVFIFKEDETSTIVKEPNLSISGNVIYNITEWSDVKVEFIKPVMDEDYFIAGSFAVNALSDHVCWDLGLLSRSSSDRSFEYFVLCKLKL